MQLMFIVVLMVVVGTLAAPEAPRVAIPEKTETHNGYEEFSLLHRSGDRIVLSESGTLKPIFDGKDKVLVTGGQPKIALIVDNVKVYFNKYPSIKYGHGAQGDNLPEFTKDY